jgi:hypothetical protein
MAIFWLQDVIVADIYADQVSLLMSRFAGQPNFEGLTFDTVD